MKSYKLFRIFLLQSIVAALLMGCGSSVELTSKWTEKKIVVDGNNADWMGIPSYTEKGRSSLSFAVCNDDEFVYVSLASQDRQIQMQILRLGFTVWFDREGGSDKTFGINFPLGMQHGGAPPDELSRRPRMDREQMNDPDQMRRSIDARTTEMEILGPGKNDRYRLSVASASGVQAKIGYAQQGTMVYELRVPLKQSAEHPYGVRVQDTKSIGIGFETGELDKEAMRQHSGPVGEPPSGGDEEGGGGFGGGGRRGGEGGGRRGGGAGMPQNPGGSTESVNLWLNVKLAAKK